MAKNLLNLRWSVGRLDGRVGSQPEDSHQSVLLVLSFDTGASPSYGFLTSSSLCKSPLAGGLGNSTLAGSLALAENDFAFTFLVTPNSLDKILQTVVVKLGTHI